MNQPDAPISIDIWGLLMACVRRWWLILLSALLAGALAFAYTKTQIAPTYESTTKIYVNNSEINVGNLSISASDLSASMKLVDVYDVILKTKDTLDIVIQQAGLPYDYLTLKSMLSSSAVNSTQVFQVTVTSTSPEEAQLIAATIGQVLPEVIGNIIVKADARVIEHAIYPSFRSSPSYSRNAIMGALGGFVVMVVILCILELTDNTIKSDEDITGLTDLPFLARIPDFHEESGKKQSYRRHSYYNANYGSKSRKRGGD